jgi:hypothetical protein
MDSQMKRMEEGEGILVLFISYHIKKGYKIHMISFCLSDPLTIVLFKWYSTDSFHLFI